jgi:aspartate aminotransferase
LAPKHALHLALAALTTPGDDVLVLQPSWPGHEASAASVGAGVVRVPAGAEGLVTVDALQAALTPRTRALLLANPSNPSGAVHPPALMRQITRWCFDHDVWLVSDEVYGGLVYDGGYRPALETVAQQDRSRLVTVDGVSKVHAMTGWRVGWLVGPEEVVMAARGQVSRTITHVPVVTQYAALAALRDGVTARTAVQQHRRNRDLLVDALRAVPGVTCRDPAAGCSPSPTSADSSGPGPGRRRRTWRPGCWSRHTLRSCPAASSAHRITSGSASPSAHSASRRPSPGSSVP